MVLRKIPVRFSVSVYRKSTKLGGQESSRRISTPVRFNLADRSNKYSTLR
jgi:hypothetical protein